MIPINPSGAKSLPTALQRSGFGPDSVNGAIRANASGIASDDGAAIAAVQRVGRVAPVNLDRVTEIRKAVEEGRYPIVPAQIADAMIAASYLLRVEG